MATHCYLDIDIDGSRAAFKLACQFVEANSIKYGLSSNNLNELGGREKLSIPELFANDYSWRDRGRVVVEPQAATRLVFELLPQQSPLACENFEALCSHSKGKSKSSGIDLTYRGSRLHRYVPGFIMQGGDLTFGNGSGGESIWGKKFKDDVAGLKLKHDSRGVLSMGNSGKNSNTSQFFVTLAPAPQCNGKHVVFGRLKFGGEVLDLIESTIAAAAAAAAAGAVKSDEEPLLQLLVTESGVWTPGVDLQQGYWNEADEFRSIA